MTCPCHSGKCYEDCCKPHHEGKLPQNALQLMRSRYSAYALCLIDYIIHTSTEPTPDKKEIENFSKFTTFSDLHILEYVEGEEEATLTFRAILFQGNKDISFTEKSFFIKKEGKWLYRLGN